MGQGLAIEKLGRFRDRAMASFIVDDVCARGPEDADAFLRFSRWVEEEGLRGETSVMAGSHRGPGDRALPLDKVYGAEAARASHAHLDAFMEVMTHGRLYDFAADRIRQDGPHEGVWLIDRARRLEEYAEYFRNIARVVEAAGIRLAGLTQPGCACEPCTAFYEGMAIRGSQATDFNASVFLALLDLLRERKLAGPVCGLFVGSIAKGPADVAKMAEDGACGVYDVPPGVGGDRFGRWDNNPQYLDPDFYLTADGSGGRLAELIALQSRTLVYYGHWQSLRPDRGIGSGAFREVARRLQAHYGDEIVWMRPTEIAAYRHTERHTALRVQDNGRGFTLRIPFEPSHALSFRVRGSGRARLVTPGGRELAPWRAFPGEASAVFEFPPENGRYEILEA